MPASQLMKDPFLSFENSKEPPQLHGFKLKLIDGPKPDSLTMEIDTVQNNLSVSTCTRSTGETFHASALELRRRNGKNEFKLEGVMNDDDSISLTLRIAHSRGM